MDKYITSAQLVEYTGIMVERAAVYWYSCFGQIASPEVYAEILARYPEKVGKWPKYTYVEQYGERAFDCSGLIKSAAGSRGDPDYICKYSDIAPFDWSANTMIANCTDVVDFEDIPEIPGMCVWKDGHVGTFIKTLPDGRKLVREAAGHMRGVIETTDTKWKRAGKLPFVDYGTEPTPGGYKCMIELDVLIKGSKGTSVKSLQMLLNGYGYKDQNGNALVVDGSFGSKTDYAVKAFQKKVYPACGDADGVVGKKTWTKLIEV